MKPNRLTPTEVSKLQEANNLLAIGLPEQLAAARKLINEVLYSAAPTVTSEVFGSHTRTPPGWNEEDEAN